MKGLASIFVLVVLLKAFMPAMDTTELAKLPLLFEHYQEHLKSNQSLTFFDFLILHYSDKDHHNADHSKHSKLPFGNLHHQRAGIQLWYAEIHVVVFPKIMSKIFHAVLTSEGKLSSNFISTVWHPPCTI